MHLMFAHKMIVTPQQNGYTGISTVLSKRLILYLKMSAFLGCFHLFPKEMVMNFLSHGSIWRFGYVCAIFFFRYDFQRF